MLFHFPLSSFVLVSNRGHNSIAVFAIKKSTLCGEAGYLRIVNYCHTKGRTPRHFQFDPSGAFLLSANQDTDSVTVFRFVLSSFLRFSFRRKVALGPQSRGRGA